ncbi:SipW-dependent-type signal peptide-containing protein [Pseudarthrobacter sp. NPDC058119]|uniref:SipW-dependent-type signal peptide-containing protein n=1 Tax=Pseudarthrobacter sp. NPDC058119 TaxID=3346348 RepID=UPI0036DABA18
MRTKRRLQAAALVAVAVVLGLFAVQGTYALWNAVASASPGTITSASFDTTLQAVNTGATTNMTLADGRTAATLTLSPAGVLGPGTSVYGGVVVTNNTNAGGQFNTAITAGPPSVANLNGGSLATYISVNAKVAASSADCSNAAGFAAISAAGLVSPTVAKGGSTVFCFQVSLSSSAPSSVNGQPLKGQAVTIQTTLTARQCGVPSGC